MVSPLILIWHLTYPHDAQEAKHEESADKIKQLEQRAVRVSSLVKLA
jgi:hypothetical protein